MFNFINILQKAFTYESVKCTWICDLYLAQLLKYIFFLNTGFCQSVLSFLRGTKAKQAFDTVDEIS